MELSPGQHEDPNKVSVSKLPPELLALIFHFCLPDYPPAPSYAGATRPAKATIANAPLLLGRICRSWRHIAVSTPTLWQTIVLEEEDAHHTVRIGDGLEYWLPHGKQLPLSVFLRFQPYHDSASAQVRKAMRLLFGRMSQWRRLHIDVPHVSFLQLFQELHDTPVLEELVLELMAVPDEYSESVGIRMPWAPRLRCVKILDWNGFLRLGGAGVCQLTCLHIRPFAESSFGFTAEYFLALLALTPGLEECAIHICDGRPVGGEVGRVCLARLGSLRLEMSLWDEAACVMLGEFLDRLFVPALRRLHCDVAPLPVAAEWSHLSALLTRSRASLEELALEGTLKLVSHFPEEELMSVLRLSPLLKSLTCRNIGVTERVLGSLILGVEARNGMVRVGECALLTKMNFTRCGNFKAEVVAEIIGSRYELGTSTSFASTVRCVEEMVLMNCGACGLRERGVVEVAVLKGMKLMTGYIRESPSFR